MPLFLDFVAIVLLAWIGYSMRKLVVLHTRMFLDFAQRCDTLHPVYSWSDIERQVFDAGKSYQKLKDAQDDLQFVKSQNQAVPQRNEPVSKDLERALNSPW